MFRAEKIGTCTFACKTTGDKTMLYREKKIKPMKYHLQSEERKTIMKNKTSRRDKTIMKNKTANEISSSIRRDNIIMKNKTSQ